MLLPGMGSSGIGEEVEGGYSYSAFRRSSSDVSEQLWKTTKRLKRKKIIPIYLCALAQTTPGRWEYIFYIFP